MRVVPFAAGLTGLALVVGAPAAAMDFGCSSRSAGHADRVAASTVEAPIVRSGDRSVVVTPRRPAPREIIVTRGVPQVLGIRQASMEPPAIYMIEADGAVAVVE